MINNLSQSEQFILLAAVGVIIFYVKKLWNEREVYDVQ